MSSLAAVPALATTSGRPGPGAGWVGRASLPRKGAHLCLSPNSSSSASPFCRAAAISLSLFYNNGAQPCRCHEAGATGPTCEPFGGQCPCRAHVIGRDCSRCATGYWGFPRCRRESHGRGCGHPLGARRTFQMLPERLGWWSWAPKLGWRYSSRYGLGAGTAGQVSPNPRPQCCASFIACECGAQLCDELTGRCICPPRTVPPGCVVCQPQSFGCHPLVGCEECNCSGPGVEALTDPTCDADSGQCK